MSYNYSKKQKCLFLVKFTHFWYNKIIFIKIKFLSFVYD